MKTTMLENWTSEKVKNSTLNLRQVVRNSGFLLRLGEGKATLPDYIYYLSNIYYVFRFLETALEVYWFDPKIEPVYTPELYRREALEEDLSVLAGDTWKHLPLLHSAEVYGNRLYALTQENPGQLGAHAYALYLSLLEDGQSYANILKHVYGFQDDALNFYRFNLVADTAGFTQNYRNSIELLPMEELDQYRFLNEIKLSHLYNLNLSMELDGANRMKSIN